MPSLTIEERSDLSQKTEYEVEAVPCRTDRGFLLAKRLFDIFGAVFGLLLLFIPMLFLAAVLALDDGFPVFFRQDRLGKDGKPFAIYKYRTMHRDAEDAGPRWADDNDSRCTALGRRLRKSRLDELPQLWNILRGDMSFVGPRPEREHFYDLFEGYIHGFRNRLAVKPGLTGLAQVNGGYDLLPEEKIVYDMQYIREQSAAMDLYCLFKTFSLLISHKGAR